MQKTVISGMMLCFIILFFLLQKVDAIDITIHAYTSAIFRLGADSRWRCNASITLENGSEENVTLLWVCFDVINITYVDGTSEIMNFRQSNFTFGEQILKPGGRCEMNVWFTNAGFEKEPRIIWIKLQSSYLEATKPVTMILPIPEFPSFLILPLFMIATLLAVVLYRRKHSM